MKHNYSKHEAALAHTWLEEHCTACLTCIFLLLFLISEGMTLVGAARDIQASVLTDLEAEADALLASVDRLASADTGDRCLWQQAMVNNDGLQDANYPWRSASAVFAYNSDICDVAVSSANALLVTALTEDGKQAVFPVRFMEDNTPEVQAMLQYVRVATVSSSTYTMTMSGYWHRGEFVAEGIELWNPKAGVTAAVYTAYSGIIEMDYQGPVTLTLGSPVEEIRDCNRETIAYGSFSVEALYKNCCTTDLQHSLQRSWTKTDLLLNDLEIAFFRDIPSGTEVAGGLRSTVVTCRKNFLDRSGVLSAADSHSAYDPDGTLADEFKLALLYRGEFHPLGLAAKKLLLCGQLPLAALLFLLAFLLTAGILRRTGKIKIIALQDEITRQQEALAYASHAEESRREMTAAIAHELKTPIAVLSGYAEALQEGVPPEKQAHYLSVLQEETAAMNRLIMELLDLSRLEAGKYTLERESFDLKALAEELLEPLLPLVEEKQLQLSWKTGEVLFVADRYRIGQVFGNFMTNAIRHTPEGGKIIIRIGVNHVMLSVENEGSRIRQEDLSKVFDRFWQADTSRTGSGTGLGLSLCSTIMKLHGGRCRVENTGIGVQFFAELTGGDRALPIRKAPRETVIDLRYPIASEETTVSSVMTHLELLGGSGLRRALRSGSVLLDGTPVTVGRTKLRSGSVLVWQSYRITVTRDDSLKRQALIHNSFTPGGGLGTRSQGFATGGGVTPK